MEPPHRRRRNRGGRGRSRGQIDRGRGRNRNPDRGRGRETCRASYPSIKDQLLKIEHRLTYVKESARHLEQVLAEIDDNLVCVFRSVRARGKQPEQKWEATDIENYNPEVELERDIEEGVDDAQPGTEEYREDEIDWDDEDKESQHLHCEHDHGYGSDENIEDAGEEQEHFEIEQPALEEEESDEDGDAYDPKAPFILDEHKIAFHEPRYDGHSPFSFQSHYENNSHVSTSIPPPNALQKPHYSPPRTNESNTFEQPNYSPTPPNESARQQAYFSPPP